MENNVLITGGSGYLGGTLLSRMLHYDIPKHNLYALVRTSAQAEAVKQYGAEPLQFSIKDDAVVQDIILKHQINIVFFLLDAVTSDSQRSFIRALSKLKKETGQTVHFLQTSGAKIFSSHADGPNEPFFDDQVDLYDIQKRQHPSLTIFQKAVQTNNLIIEDGEALGVRTYIFIPCIVYGKGEGFGNPISIQTVAIFKAAKALGKVYRIEKDTEWPVCHVIDNATLYLQLLKGILENKDMDYGRQGYYLAASGSVGWEGIYAKFAQAMFERGMIKDPVVGTADDTVLNRMAKALESPKSMVAPQLSGSCMLGASHGLKIGWKPQFRPEDILNSIQHEVELISKALYADVQGRL